ncbi:MAG: hypothetical protein A2289_08140 [Deltaproteobacteria bacterium RIFOXYA12_FULL_58_15]|nr:MAG: hypothetical protein A2289_08140 [Deltaproteobacteria bacterium RIFOXYA12_FULL_58_15]OGR09480.1 MAG: hypothetical protein A2341_01625 [Deltaproteobacteria bacterium RIFOXYB12_FULL_58_9]
MDFIKPAASSPAPGREVDSYCGSCKLELAHVIVAMDGSRIAKVQCNTCRKTHSHRGQQATNNTTTTAKTKPSPTRKTKSNLTHSEYDRLIGGRDISRATPYKITTCFTEKHVIDHPKFGLGVVIRILGDDKVEVGFPSGVKVLVHNRP